MDLRAEIVGYLCDEALTVEPAWSLRLDDEVLWWPSDLPQRIHVRRTRPPGADEVVVDVETDVLRGVPSLDDDVARALNASSWSNALSTLSVGPDGVLRLHCALRVTQHSVRSLRRWLAWLAACQAADALVWSDATAVLGVEAERATGAHPTSGTRADTAPALALRRALVERGELIGPEVGHATVVAGLARLDGGDPEAGEDGAAVTTQRWVVASAHPARWADRGRLTTSAWLEDDQDYGPSVVVRTEPPWAVPPELAVTIAAGANEVPRGSSAMTTLGTWLARPDAPGLAVRTVVPLGLVEAQTREALAGAVAFVARAQSDQATDLVRVVEAMSPDGGRPEGRPEDDGPDPYLR